MIKQLDIDLNFLPLQVVYEWDQGLERIYSIKLTITDPDAVSAFEDEKSYTKFEDLIAGMIIKQEGESETHQEWRSM